MERRRASGDRVRSVCPTAIALLMCCLLSASVTGPRRRGEKPAATFLTHSPVPPPPLTLGGLSGAGPLGEPANTANTMPNTSVLRMYTTLRSVRNGSGHTRRQAKGACGALARGECCRRGALLTTPFRPAAALLCGPPAAPAMPKCLLRAHAAGVHAHSLRQGRLPLTRGTWCASPAGR